MRLEYFLRTPRIGFRLWKEDDLHLAIGLWGDFKVTQFFDARGKLSQAQVNERLLREISAQKMHGIQYWPIFHLKDDRHLGCCGLRPYDKSKNVLEIGFHIRYRHWGQGYAFEAADAVVSMHSRPSMCQGFLPVIIRKMKVHVTCWPSWGSDIPTMSFINQPG